MRTEVIQEKQASEDLNTIYFFLEASIASANECAITKANTLYCTANAMLDRFIKNNCNCTGTNFLTNFV